MLRLGLLSLVLSGCLGSAVPQPPNLDPVDRSKVGYDTEEAEGSFIVLLGAPGAAEPNARLYVWNLDTAEPPVVTEIAGDGSFTAVIPSEARGVVLRLQARLEDARSLPIDLIPDVGRSSPPDRPDCLTVAIEVELADRSGEIAIDNDCEEEVSLGETRLRMTDDFVIDRPSALRLPPSSSATLGISAPSDLDTEDILFVTLERGVDTFLYPVTLIAPAR
jgi:hypothetical protein